MSPVRSIDELFPHATSAGAGTVDKSDVRSSIWLYSLAIFLGAFLLFQVEPLIGKVILPWFGGSAGVWTTCLLFFQILLFAGYAYAHVGSVRFTPRTQAILHGGLLLVACLALPILPNATWKPIGTEEPLSRIIAVLTVTVGLPFFVLSASGPVLQRWFSGTHPGHSPYRLYALSNLGSLLALLSYPSVFDWNFSTGMMARIWSWSFLGFALLCAACAWTAARRRPAEPVTSQQPHSREVGGPPPSWGLMVLWFSLAMVASVLLLAITNQVCLDVASVPFLWVLPLALYLISFVLCFDGERWYSRAWSLPAIVAAMSAVYYVLAKGAVLSLGAQVGVYFATLFVCCMLCHGELARLKPNPRHLTLFYLLLSGGGAAGGVFVAIIAPFLFENYYELHIGLFACAALTVIVLYRDLQTRISPKKPVAIPLMLAGLGLLAFGLFREVTKTQKDVIATERNFYGVLRLMNAAANFRGSKQSALALWNGRILHGFEYKTPQLRRLPTTYYNPESGAGLILADPYIRKPRRVGLIGLGVGTLATYARPGDYFRFYELNPADVRMAREQFHFLSDCRGKVDVIIGDGRLALDREPPQNFDLIVLDAFSSDAIPVHLLTVEAFEIYLRHLNPEGIIAVHISNRHFALRPVVEAVADKHQLQAAAVDTPLTFNGTEGTNWFSSWVLVSPSAKSLQTPEIRQATLPPDNRRVLWTDERASLLSAYWMNRRRGDTGAAASSRH